jgi:glycosyltransferase involved in cell wall biosynthesis
MFAENVSVVITSYNQKGYLIDALDSVIAQTHPVYEVIVADDASQDGSVEVIRDYMERYPGLVKGVFNPRNQGIPRNRNSGLGRVSGDCVFILDGDDRFLPGNVARMLAELRSNPRYGCVYGNLKFIDAEGGFKYVRYRERQPSGSIFFEVASGKFGILRNMIIHARLLHETGFFDARFPRYDGFELTVRLAKRCDVGYVHEPLAEYRVYPTSDSSGLKAIDHWRDLHGIFRKMRPLLRDLPDAQRSELRRIWTERLRSYYLQDLRENPRRMKSLALPLLLLLRRYIPLRRLFRAFRFDGEA